MMKTDSALNMANNSPGKKHSKTSFMRSEALESASIVKNQLIDNKDVLTKLGERLRQYSPKAIMMIGRGSSDHAGSFAKYLFEIETQIPAFTAAPSVSTVYGKQLRLTDYLVIVISQSGKSPDIIEQTKMAKSAGAYCVALVNETDSPLAEIVDCFVPLMAGVERSVAATKSFIATLSTLIQMVGYWKNDNDMLKAAHQLPEALANEGDSPQQLTANWFGDSNNLVVLGRGLGFAIGMEMALKIKEVCAIHAESFSSAEFLHGPVSLLQQQLKIINVQIEDEAKSVHESQIEELISRGAKIANLKHTSNLLHPRIAPLVVLLRFYLDIEKVAQSRGFDPDRPLGLKKVTETI